MKILMLLSSALVLNLVSAAHGSEALRSVDPAAARRGFENIAFKPYMEGRMNFLMFNNIWRTWDPEAKAKAKKATKAERKKMILERYGFFDTPYENGGVPMGFLKGKLGLWSNNCLICHGGSIQGKPMVGLGNAFLDLEGFATDAGRLLGQKPPGDWLNHSTGTTNAFQFSVLAVATRDPDMNLRKNPISFPTVQGADLDPPAWWLVKKKTRLYSDGFTEVSPRALMQFLVSSRRSGEKIRGWAPDFDDVVQWIDSIEAPKYPGMIVTVRAERGKQVFEQNCASCHGTYGPTPSAWSSA